MGWGSMSGNGTRAGRALGKDRETFTHCCVNTSKKESIGLKVLDLTLKTEVPALALVSSPGSGISLLWVSVSPSVKGGNRPVLLTPREPVRTSGDTAEDVLGTVSCLALESHPWHQSEGWENTAAA